MTRPGPGSMRQQLHDATQRHGEGAEHDGAGDAAGDGLRQPLPQERVDEEADERKERDERSITDRLRAQGSRSARVAGAQGCRARYHLSDVNTSGLSDSLCRNSAMTSARPTAASAAATVITKNTMTWPSTAP